MNNFIKEFNSKFLNSKKAKLGWMDKKGIIHNEKNKLHHYIIKCRWFISWIYTVKILRSRLW